MLKKILITALLIAPFSCLAVITPRSSSYDSHMQNVAYNSQNSTSVNARVGYVSTLIFDDDEEVIEAEAGFENGWIIKKSANRVKIRPAPITQPVTNPDGTTVKQVFLPTSKDWKTNLFITTSKNRHYSVVLNVIDDDKPIDSLAFVVKYSYPDDMRQLSDVAKQARERELLEQRENALIATAFEAATAPRNWEYSKRVATGSESIAPDFAYDDGRFTYLGFSPQKTIPSPFVVVNDAEQVVTPTFARQGNYNVMTVRTLTPRLVLRYGQAVVGIENTGYGKVAVASGDTVSTAVELEAK